MIFAIFIEMSALRKLASHNIRNIVRNGFKAPVMARQFSSVMDLKERGDETKYIRDIEHRRKEEMRANLERIMALEDTHEEKAGLVELLGEFFDNRFLEN